jgi:hypothetical protein
MSAIELYAEAASPFDEARAMLELGSRLRRQRKSVAARDQIRRALGTFERLGAAPWIDRAQQELRVSGEVVREG